MAKLFSIACVDKVILTEEHVSSGKKTISTEFATYPSHEDVGHAILTSQSDLRSVLGKRTDRIANLFSGKNVSDQQLGKLLHSNLDMDRLDYLIRDSQATGVPYGLVDINYLLNNIRRAKDGSIGISHKAIAAAEHLLLARSFLFRVVCQHKTVFGLEEAARQLLRRLRNRAQSEGESYTVPKDGDAIIEIAQSSKLLTFTDAFLDDVFAKASEDKEEIVRDLAKSLISRQPPILLWEKKTFTEKKATSHVGELFKERCKTGLETIAKKYGLSLGHFLICDLKPIGFESRGSAMSKQDWEKAKAAGEAEEMIRVFTTAGSDKLTDIVEVEHSLLSEIGGHIFRTYRLYVVCPNDDCEKLIPNLKADATELFKGV